MFIRWRSLDAMGKLFDICIVFGFHMAKYHIGRHKNNDKKKKKKEEEEPISLVNSISKKKRLP